MRRASAAALLLALASPGIARDATGPAAGGLPEILPLEPGVKDPVFAILVALLRSDHYGALTREHLERELGRRRQRSRLPYQQVREVCRLPLAQGQALVRVRFEGALNVPIPYSILWYHPGSVRADDSCTFREWSLGMLRLPHEAKGEPAGTTLELREVHLFGLEHGRLEVDIDGWLDRLMGSAIDDTGVTGLAFFELGGRDFAMAVGYNRKRRARSGAFDLAEDRIVFPYPSELKTIGRLLRWRLETLAQEPASAAPAAWPLAPLQASEPGGFNTARCVE